MSNIPTREEVLAMIVPKSDQLNTENLLTGSITVTVENVRLTGDDKQPMAIDITGHRPFKPCLTCRRVLVKLWTDDAETWIGKQMTLFADPEVILKGHTVGGVRISHLSDIDKTETLMLSESRNNKKPVVIHPINKASPSTPGVSQERLDWLKVGWAKKHAEILSPDDDKKLLFAQWAQQTLGENFSDDGKLDVNDNTSWSVEDMVKCEKEIEAIPGE